MAPSLSSATLSALYSSLVYAAAILRGFLGTTAAAERWAVFDMLAKCICKSLALPEKRAGHQDAAPRRREEEACLALPSIRWSMLSLGRADPDSCIARRLAIIAKIAEDGLTITAVHVGESMLAAAAEVKMKIQSCITRLLSNLRRMLDLRA